MIDKQGKYNVCECHFVEQVQHPAAKMLVMASHMQEQEVGDGTNFVLVFAGALLELAEELLRMGLSVSEVSRCIHVSF